MKAKLRLREIFIVAGIIAIAGAMFLRVKMRSHEVANRVKCAKQLKALGTAMMMYANENRGWFPRTKYNPGAPPTFHWDTGDGEKFVDPFTDAPWNGYENDVAMAIFLIIRTQDAGSEVFVCLSSNAEKDRYGSAPTVSAQNKASFTSLKNLSYSFANPYPAVELPKLGLSQVEFSVAADMNPGIGDGYDPTVLTLNSTPEEMKKGNSRNHGGVGQNVMNGDMHVEFVRNPFVGIRRDNIYTVSGDGEGDVTSKVIVGAPKNPFDSVLLPAYK